MERDVNKAKQQLKFHSSSNKMSPEVKSKVDEVRQLFQGVCRYPAQQEGQREMGWFPGFFCYAHAKGECLCKNKTSEVANSI